MPITLLARNWDYLKQQQNHPDDIVPVDIVEVATWFFEEDATDYRDCTWGGTSGECTRRGTGRRGRW